MYCMYGVVKYLYEGLFPLKENAKDVIYVL
jgi:hypothetical protein